MTSFIMSQAPLMVAGKLPLDKKSLQFLANPLALQIAAKTGKTHAIHYQGNCTLVHGSIPRDFFPANPCVQLWTKGNAQEGNKKMELALINLGENTTSAAPSDSPVLKTAMSQSGWTGVDVWTGQAVSTSGKLTLRPHASRLLQFTKAQ
jgi:hypothetical protein